MSTPLISLQNATFGYGLERIVSNIDWHIQKGQHWLITGATGSGKTTLMTGLNGKARLFEGTIKYHLLDNPDSFAERSKAIHMVSFMDHSRLFNSVDTIHYYQQRYQAFDSDGYVTTRDYLLLKGYTAGSEQHDNIIDLMQLRPLLDIERIKLSSGQTRKLLLCAALMGSPQVLILDNPHIGLDHDSRQIFNDFIDRAADELNVTYILSGQFRNVPGAITHRLHLQDGEVMDQGPLDHIRRDLFTVPKVQIMDTKIAESFQNPIKIADEVLNFEDVSIKYEAVPVLDGLNWQVSRGDKWVVLGKNGVGKSTLISLIYGDHPQAYANQISLFGQKRGSGESIWDIKKKIGFTSPELHAYFNYDHKAEDVVLSGFWDIFYTNNPSQEQRNMVGSLFAYFSMEDIMQLRFPALSSGTQRLLLFMRAIVKAPPVLLFDEPYQGLDQDLVHHCNHLLSQILTHDHTMIFISHYRDEVPDMVTQHLEL